MSDLPSLFGIVSFCVAGEAGEDRVTLASASGYDGTAEGANIPGSIWGACSAGSGAAALAALGDAIGEVGSNSKCVVVSAASELSDMAAFAPDADRPELVFCTCGEAVAAVAAS